jgi:hypothetical protein
MGYSLSWLAVKGKPAEAVCDELGFRKTGEREQIPESDLSGAELPGGWFLIVSNRTEKVASDAILQCLSSSGSELVTCFIEEHVMVSVATGWREGRRIWSVTHDAQRAGDDLTVEGDLPPEFVSIRDRLLSKQREEDLRIPVARHGSQRSATSVEQMRCDYIFDVPVETAQRLTGFRHDRDIPGVTGEPFEMLLGRAPAKSGSQLKGSFWKRWFGGFA